jgi:hypothetical protein
MTASQFGKFARNAGGLSTSHGRARPDVRQSSQFARQFTELDATRRSFVSRFIVGPLVGPARSQSPSPPAAPKSP